MQLKEQVHVFFGSEDKGAKMMEKAVKCFLDEQWINHSIHRIGKFF